MKEEMCIAVVFNLAILHKRGLGKKVAREPMTDDDKWSPRMTISFRFNLLFC